MQNIIHLILYTFDQLYSYVMDLWDVESLRRLQERLCLHHLWTTDEEHPHTTALIPNHIWLKTEPPHYAAVNITV